LNGNINNLTDIEIWYKYVHYYLEQPFVQMNSSLREGFGLFSQRTQNGGFLFSAKENCYNVIYPIISKPRYFDYSNLVYLSNNKNQLIMLGYTIDSDTSPKAISELDYFYRRIADISKTAFYNNSSMLEIFNSPNFRFNFSQYGITYSEFEYVKTHLPSLNKYHNIMLKVNNSSSYSQ
jgi:hypothetical protein